MRRSFGFLLLFAAMALVTACTGILGLDATTERSDASDERDAGRLEDASHKDASSKMDGGKTDGTTRDAQGDAKRDAREEAGDDATEPDAADDEDALGDDGSEASPPPPPPTDAATPPAFTVATSPLVVRQGATLDVHVTLDTNTGMGGSWSITFGSLPTGVTATMATVTTAAPSAHLVITAAATATVGQVTINLEVNQKAGASYTLFVFGPAGTVDTTLGGGYVADPAAGSKAIFNAVAIDAQGRIVAGGGLSAGGWLLHRFSAAGVPDTAFNAATSTALPTTGTLSGIAVDLKTNDIVCAGTTGSTAQLTVAVVDGASGNLAGTFNGGTAFSYTTVFTQTSAGYAVTIGPLGSFSFAGSHTQGQQEGLLTSSISESSTITPGSPAPYVGPSASTLFRALAADAKGNLVAAGSDTSAQPTMFVERFLHGAPDTTFGDAGVAGDNGFFCEAASIAIRPTSGAIVVGGFNIGMDTGCMAQWETDGGASWMKQGTGGGGGLFTYAGAAPMPGDAMDRVYVVGSGGDSFGRSSEIDRVNLNGSYDTTFGTTGSVQTSDSANSPPAFYYTLEAVAVQPDGRIVIAGQKTVTGGTPTVQAVIGRFYP